MGAHFHVRQSISSISVVCQCITKGDAVFFLYKLNWIIHGSLVHWINWFMSVVCSTLLTYRNNYSVTIWPMYCVDDDTVMILIEPNWCARFFCNRLDGFSITNSISVANYEAQWKAMTKKYHYFMRIVAFSFPISWIHRNRLTRDQVENFCNFLRNSSIHQYHRRRESCDVEIDDSGNILFFSCSKL